jgi:hypothetical protein
MMSHVATTGGSPSATLAMRRPPAERLLIIVAGLAAAIPVIVSTIRALAAGWAPEGDNAVIATRAYDVLTSLTPLVGPWSSTSNVLGEDTYHPGPLLYWLLAIPARLPGEAAFPVVIGVLNVAAIMGTVALARRRGGRGLMLATAGAVALMSASLEVRALHDIWNPTAPLLAFVLLLFVCWSLGCGEHRLLPLAILLASFAMQCHLVFVVPGLVLLGVGVGGLIASRRTTRGESTDSAAGSLRRWSLAGVVVALLCWSAPLVDQALDWTGSDSAYGNLETLVDAAQSREQPAGTTAGVYAVVRATGVPPWWLRSPTPEQRTLEVFARPGAPAIASTAIILLTLVVLAVLGARRGRPDVAASAGLALAACAALGVVTASFPGTLESIFSYGYTSSWAAPVGMWTWLVAVWSSLSLWSDARAEAGRRAPTVPSAVTVAAVVAVSAIGAVVAAVQGPVGEDGVFAASRSAMQGLAEALPDPGTVRVDSAVFELEAAVIYALRRRGADVGAGDTSGQFGDAYDRRGRRFEHIVDVRHSGVLPPGARRVARGEYRAGRRLGFSVSLRPGR